jgi:fumarate reductase subunit D
MLFLVMAIMVYGLLDTDSLKSRFYKFVYLFLGIVAFVINVIALSAIFYRVNEFGLSPNRLAVLGSNLLIATHIALIVLSVLKVIRGKAKIDFALKSVSVFLPVYLIWVIIVVFSFPVMF